MKNLKIIGLVIVVLIIAIVAVVIYKNNRSQSEDVVLHVGYLPLTDHMPLMVAAGGSMFKDVKVEPVKFTDFPSELDALKAGKIDAAHTISTLAIKAFSMGYKGKIVALSHRGDLALITKPEITDIQQLKGKTIAVPSHISSHYLMLVNYLTANGFDMKKDVTVIDVNPPDYIATMASGKIDGFLGSEPFPTLAETKNVGKIFKLWTDMQIPGTDGLDCVVVFSDDFIKNHPQLVQNYVTSIINTGSFIESNPEKAAEYASPMLLGLAPAVIVKAKTDGKSSYNNLTPVLSEFETYQDYMVRAGLLTDKIDLNNFVTSAYAEKAYGKK